MTLSAVKNTFHITSFGGRTAFSMSIEASQTSPAAEGTFLLLISVLSLIHAAFIWILAYSTQQMDNPRKTNEAK